VATGATGEPPGEGADVTLSARPERLGIAPAGDGGDADGAWPGRVADVSFLGNTIRYEIALPWDERLKIDTLAGREPMLPEGREVRVLWDAGAAVLVGEDR
jgi:ABC-type Fe3+/spermidine/putrescine transport system ATPase subunit